MCEYGKILILVKLEKIKKDQGERKSMKKRKYLALLLGDGGEYRVSGGLRFQLWILQRQPDAEAEKVFGMTGLCRSAFPGIDGEEGKDTVES